MEAIKVLRALLNLNQVGLEALLSPLDLHSESRFRIAWSTFIASTSDVESFLLRQNSFWLILRSDSGVIIEYTQCNTGVNNSCRGPEENRVPIEKNVSNNMATFTCIAWLVLHICVTVSLSSYWVYIQALVGANTTKPEFIFLGIEYHNQIHI